MGRRKRVAILVGQADEYYQAELICGLEKQAFSYDWDVCVFSMYQKYQSSTEREQGETCIFSLVPYEDLDGIVLMLDTLQTPGLADAVEETVHDRAKCPVISIDKKSRYFYSVELDHYKGEKTMMSHLIEHHGFKDIAFLTGKAWHPYSKVRMQAFKDSMAEHGLEIRSNRMFYGDFWYTSGENVGERLAKDKDNLPEAIACANDCMAIGVCKALTNNGIRIPEDVAVVGYDANEEGNMSPVPITSVKFPADALGKYAMDCIKTMSEGKDPEPFDSPFNIFMGRSCGCELKKEDSVLALRQGWDTNTSTNSVFSNLNHLDDDLLAQRNFYGIISTMFTYIYQLREFESFNICINEGWDHFGKCAEENETDPAMAAAGNGSEQIDYDFLQDPGRFFSVRMANVLSCRPEKLNSDRIGLNYFFDRKKLIPRLDEERALPEVFIFSPLHFDSRTFGYAVVSYTKPSSYGDNYRLWLRSVMRGIETLRRQVRMNRKLDLFESNLIRDPLTGLYNYRGFTQKIDGMLFRYKGSGRLDLGALSADIRNLSAMNDKDGRAAGDRAIIYLGKLMQEAFPEGQIFAMGNGEITVIDSLTRDGRKRFDTAIETIRAKLAEFSKTNNYQVPVDIYYGYAEGRPEDRNEFERITSIALTNKNAYKLRIRALSGENGSEADSNTQADMVRDILDHNRIKYHFQPIVDAHTGEIFAYEALMRVDVVPYIQPPVVLKFAELFGRLYDVEASTFNNILDIIDTRTSEFREGSKVFINSIPGQRLKGKDADRLYEITSRHRNMVVVEFTEETELTDDDLANLKKTYEPMGVELAIDDYGTGYSNVSNLLRYMPRYIKIDRSLLSDIQSSPQKQHFVKDILTFCHDNNIKALAEGVETQEELATVIHLGVDYIQGYYTARPAEAIIKEIRPEIREEIVKFNRLEEDERSKNIYIAGREPKILLQHLITNEYKDIRVPNGKSTFRDITVSGIPGTTTEIGLVIEDGYTGHITLDNAYLSGKKKKGAIIVGEGCDVTIALKGENVLDTAGILIPKSSKVTFEGAGNLCITATGTASFGIGNDMEFETGSLVFDQDGTIEIILGAPSGVCIGAGKGCDIDIRRGRYFLRMQGTYGTGIGTLSGDLKLSVVNCAIDLNANVMNCVGIGSQSGALDLKIEHISFTSSVHGNDISLIGTLDAKDTKVNIYSVNIQSRINASRSVMFGSLCDSPSAVSLDYTTIGLEAEGKQVSFFRGTDKTSRLSLTNSHLEGRLFSGLEAPCKLDDMDFHIEKTGAKISVNGEMLYDGTY